MGIARILLVAVVGGVGYTGVPAVSLDSLADLIPEHNESQSLYQVSAVTRAELTKTIAATGTIDATINVEVGSQLSGQIASLSADFNDTVSKGQVLAQLDDRTYRAQVDSARAALEGAKADVQVAEAKLARAKIDAEQTASHARPRAPSGSTSIGNCRAEARRKATLGGKALSPQAKWRTPAPIRWRRSLPSGKPTRNSHSRYGVTPHDAGVVPSARSRARRRSSLGGATRKCGDRSGTHANSFADRRGRRGTQRHAGPDTGLDARDAHPIRGRRRPSPHGSLCAGG